MLDLRGRERRVLQHKEGVGPEREGEEGTTLHHKEGTGIGPGRKEQWS